MGFRKGQAALDFLMTYGWAIALMVIVAAVLFALGVFDVSNFVGSKAAGFSGVSVTGWKLDTAGALTMKVSNQVGNPIRLNSISATVGDVTQTLDANTTQTIATGASTGVLTGNNFAAQSSGSGYTAKVTIGYLDTVSGFNYTTTGTLTGKVTS